MSQNGSYKKITVSSSASNSTVDEQKDEEVIYIGASTSPSPVSSKSLVTHQEASVDSDKKAIGDKTQSGKAELPKEIADSEKQYREQTLEDLNNIDVPFHKTQRIVLIVMALLVIAFCVYWFGLR